MIQTKPYMERWECRLCNGRMPCQISIKTEDTEQVHERRFRMDLTCICMDRSRAEWIRLDRKEALTEVSDYQDDAILSKCVLCGRNHYETISHPDTCDFCDAVEL